MPKLKLSKKVKSKNIFYLLMIFLFMSILVRGNGMTNANSRFATMQAMSDSFSFKIDDYKDWTVDWSYIDGHYYSNKAPGPALLGFPIYFLITKIRSKFNEKANKVPPTSSVRSSLNLLIQVLPIFLILFLFMNNLLKDNPNFEFSGYLGILLLLFGNTTSLFYNSYFGHGMAAVFTFLMAFFLYKKEYVYLGLFFGLALLTDYSAGLFLVPLIFCIPRRGYLDFIKGGILPGILWIFYHYNVTGSIFETPNKYINPLFKSDDKDLIWGAISTPKLNIIFELLFGLKRGLLITQPWVLMAILLLLKSIFSDEKKYIRVYVVSVLGFLLILLLNASFNGWHGGATSGPRYLCVALSPLCFSIILLWSSLRKEFKALFLLLVIYSLLFRGLIYATNSMASEDETLLPYLLTYLAENGSFKQYLRIPIFLGLILFSFVKNDFYKFAVTGKNKAPRTSS